MDAAENWGGEWFDARIFHNYYHFATSIKWILVVFKTKKPPNILEMYNSIRFWVNTHTASVSNTFAFFKDNRIPNGISTDNNAQKKNSNKKWRELEEKRWRIKCACI